MLLYVEIILLIQKRNSLTGCPVICRRDADTRSGVAGVDNLAAADVDGHMVNVIAAGIEQQISRLGITDWYGLSSGSLVPGASSRTDAEMSKYALGHHFALVYGDYVEEVKAFAKECDLEVLEA